METKLKSHLLALNQADRGKLADKLGTTVPYLLKIAGGFQLPGTELCAKLIAVVPGLTLNDLIAPVQARARAKTRKGRR
jgi:hypothetical protein